MSISTVSSFYSLPANGWGNLNCFPLEVIREIFRYVIGGKEGPTHFTRLAQTCINFSAFCQWTIIRTPWMEISPLTREMQFARTHLKKAVKLGCVEATKQLMQREEIPPDASKDLTVLLIAIREGQEEIVQVLLSHDRTKKIDFNSLASLSLNPMAVALKSRHSNIASLLWKSGRFPANLQFLCLAIEYGHPRMVEELLKNLKGASDLRQCFNIPIKNKQMAAATLTALLKSRRVLIDPLGPEFKILAQGALTFVAGLVAALAIGTLIVAGIAFLIAGTSGALAAFSVALTIVGPVYLIVGLVAISILGVVVLGHHLFVIARATALIAYHHFSQKAATAAQT